MDDDAFGDLRQYLARVPAVEPVASHGAEPDGSWWVKLVIDIGHPLAWHVVQELGHVLNYLSLEERLPTAFKPVSPPPYLNGGPEDFLSWVIEGEPGFAPSTCTQWLDSRLPDPVDDEASWRE